MKALANIADAIREYVAVREDLVRGTVAREIGLAG